MDLVEVRGGEAQRTEMVTEQSGASDFLKSLRLDHSVIPIVEEMLMV